MMGEKTPTTLAEATERMKAVRDEIEGKRTL
jgi:hypothetical protein